MAAGAGLLFGVNAFCLDGSGSLWLSTIPGWWRHAYWAKARVTAECVGVATLIALGCRRRPRPGAGQRHRRSWPCSPRRPPAPRSWSRPACGIPCAARTGPTCGDRATPPPRPAPWPSTRLDWPSGTTLTGLLFTVLALAPQPWLPAVAAVPFLARAGLSLKSTERDWAQPTTRARVVTTVAAG